MISPDPNKLDVLSTAKKYAALGLAVIPIRAGTKTPALKSWKRYQKERPTELEQLDWFDGRDDLGIAVVCGKVSGGLTCRDFDVEQSYHVWAGANPELAAFLPTAKTARGYHVFFRSDLDRVEKLVDGELRGDGAIVVLPPSRHPSGFQYRWLREPSAEIPVVDAEVMRSRNPQRDGETETQRLGVTETLSYGDTETQRLGETEQQRHRDTDSMASVSLPLCGFDNDEAVKRAIEKNLPTRLGERNRKLFDFARSLRGIAALASASVEVLEPIVRRWHQVALPVIRTKEFSESWADFLNAWDSVKFAEGDGIVKSAWEKAQRGEIPAEAQKHDSESIRRLAALCLELQRMHGEGRKFFLATRTAALLLSRDHSDVAKWLKMLVREVMSKVVDAVVNQAATWVRIWPSWNLVCLATSTSHWAPSSTRQRRAADSASLKSIVNVALRVPLPLVWR